MTDRISFGARPLVLSAARVSEIRFSLSPSTARYLQSGAGMSTGSSLLPSWASRAVVALEDADSKRGRSQSEGKLAPSRPRGTRAQAAGQALIAGGQAAGPKRRTFMFVNNRLEGNAISTIGAMLEPD